MDPIITDPQATQTADQAHAAIFPSGEEVYDGLMAQIEPELLSANIPHLDEAYPSETEEEKKARYDRYSAAFVKYDEMYAEWEKNLNEIVTDYRKDALTSAETESKQEDASALAQLEQNFGDAPVAATPAA